MYPFVAFFIAGYIQYIADVSKRTIKVYAVVICVMAILLLSVFVFIQCGGFPYEILKGKHALENAMYVTALAQHFSWLKWFIAEIPVILALDFVNQDAER